MIKNNTNIEYILDANYNFINNIDFFMSALCTCTVEAQMCFTKMS